MAKFGCKPAALRLEHIANDDPRSFRGEQASLGCALSACASADQYYFPFEAIHSFLHLIEECWFFGSLKDAYHAILTATSH
jgi:hypothetical protein